MKEVTAHRGDIIDGRVLLRQLAFMAVALTA